MNDLVVVTGASRGLGLAIVRRLVKDGYRVVALSRSHSDEIAALTATSPNVTWQSFDLRGIASSFQERVASIAKEFGPIYGLVNNAAIAHDGILATQHEREIVEQIEVNLTGTILFTKYASRAMLPQRRGRVINIASIIAFTGYNGLAVYGATKAAMIGFTRSLARELGRAKITVNAIAPGYMETGMTGGLSAEQLGAIRRRSALLDLVSPDKVAGAVAYLMGPDGAATTGATLTVDAGSTA
jgi:3-oxoacyl-[acyl-carrier protein] reductase